MGEDGRNGRAARGERPGGVRVPGPGVGDDQPRPAHWSAWHLPGSPGWHTVVERVWSSHADVESCRLCPLARCTARQRDVTVCTVVFSGYLPDAVIPLARWSDPNVSSAEEAEEAV